MTHPTTPPAPSPQLPAPLPLDPLALDLSGLHLIEASAGTGKTHTITTLYLRLVIERGLDVGRILVVTFTNAATAELRTRIRARLLAALAAFRSEEEVADDEHIRALVRRRREAGAAASDVLRLERALTGLDEAAILTIHGFCQRTLHDHAFESGITFDCELLSDQSTLLQEIVDDFWCAQLAPASPELLERIGDEKIKIESLFSLSQLAIRHRDAPVLPFAAPGKPAIEFVTTLIAYARRECDRRKQERNVQFFDDLLYRLSQALAADGGPILAKQIAERYPVALIDEFQDTDPTQYTIFERIYSRQGTTLILVGDPKQAIYAFRGADVYAYLKAKRRAAAPVTLNVSRRSDPGLLRAINALFETGSDPFLLKEIPYLPMQAAPDAQDRLQGGAPMEFLIVHPEPGKRVVGKTELNRNLPAQLAAEIARTLAGDLRIEGRRILPSDIAVLCRTNAQAFKVQEALRVCGIPAVLYGDASVFDSAEAEHLERLLRAMADPSDAAAVTAALATPIFGMCGEELIEIHNDDARWDPWLRSFHDWHEAWLSRGFTPAFHRLLEESQVMARLLAFPNGERCLTNLLHLVELLQTAAAEDRRRPFTLVEWLAHMRENKIARAELVGDSAQIRLESDASALTLTTIHKSKGLEYSVVYCPYLWDDKVLKREANGPVLFHDPKNDDRLTIDVGSQDADQHAQQRNWEAIAENLRLTYVALTRARHRCSIVWGKINQAEHSALAYLLHGSSGQKRDTFKTAYKAIREQDVIDRLEELSVGCGGAIEVKDLTDDPAPPYNAESPQEEAPFCRELERPIRRGWWTSSFSALTTFAESPAQEPAEIEADHDEITLAPLEESAQPSGVMVPLHDFPAGPRAGQMIHSVFEHLDFSAAHDSGAIGSLSSSMLARFGLELRWSDSLSRAISGVLQTPLDGTARLCDVAGNRRLNELEFLIPVAAIESDEGEQARLTAGRLADLFTRHRAPAALPGYAERVRALGFTPLAGFLRGFIDLVFEHDGRWFVVDYKSNWLGANPADYRVERLIPSMSDHHYFLQYHLYAVALHRYLQRRQPGYDYERHFGGVYYLFLRGMAPDYPAGNGVFHDRPSKELIEELSECFKVQHSS